MKGENIPAGCLDIFHRITLNFVPWCGYFFSLYSVQCNNVFLFVQSVCGHLAWEFAMVQSLALVQAPYEESKVDWKGLCYVCPVMWRRSIYFILWCHSRKYDKGEECGTFFFFLWEEANRVGRKGSEIRFFWRGKYIWRSVRR